MLPSFIFFLTFLNQLDFNHLKWSYANNELFLVLRIIIEINSKTKFEFYYESGIPIFSFSHMLFFLLLRILSRFMLHIPKKYISISIFIPEINDGTIFEIDYKSGIPIFGFSHISSFLLLKMSSGFILCIIIGPIILLINIDLKCHTEAIYQPFSNLQSEAYLERSEVISKNFDKNYGALFGFICHMK